MSDEELIKVYKVGKRWLIQHSQVSEITKNELGEMYDHESFMLGLNRIETIEDELMQRGINYG
jgi:hypothetical protein